MDTVLKFFNTSFTAFYASLIIWFLTSALIALELLFTKTCVKN